MNEPRYPTVVTAAIATGAGRPAASGAALRTAGATTATYRARRHGLSRLLAIVVLAEADGTWARLKACPGQNCHWALYDHTRSRTRTWCAAEKCGARARARAYRRRRAG